MNTLSEKTYQSFLPRLERCKRNGAPIVWYYTVNASNPDRGHLYMQWEGYNAQSSDIRDAMHLLRVTDKLCRMFG